MALFPMPRTGSVSDSVWHEVVSTELAVFDRLCRSNEPHRSRDRLTTGGLEGLARADN